MPLMASNRSWLCYRSPVCFGAEGSQGKGKFVHAVYIGSHPVSIKASTFVSDRSTAFRSLPISHWFSPVVAHHGDGLPFGNVHLAEGFATSGFDLEESHVAMTFGVQFGHQLEPTLVIVGKRNPGVHLGVGKGIEDCQHLVEVKRSIVNQCPPCGPKPRRILPRTGRLDWTEAGEKEPPKS